MNSFDIYNILNLSPWAEAVRRFYLELISQGFTSDQAHAFALSLFTAAANAQTSFNLNVQGK